MPRTMTTKRLEQRRLYHQSSFLMAALMGRLSLTSTTTMAYSSHPNTPFVPNSVPKVHVWKPNSVSNHTTAPSSTTKPLSSSTTSFAATVLTDTPQRQQEQEQQQHPRVVYDLGLGKNPPVLPKKRVHQSVTTTPQSNQEAAQYWFHDETINNLRSPLPPDASDGKDAPKHSFSSRTHSTKKKPTPFLKPQRQTSDLLRIQDRFKNRSSTPPPPQASAAAAAAASSSTENPSSTGTAATEPLLPRMAWSPSHDRIQLDVNTIWVEMLLHQQQQDWMEANTI